ncbi:MAG: hypothetical protein ABIQ13_02485 [Pedococcus sp.]
MTPTKTTGTTYAVCAMGAAITLLLAGCGGSAPAPAGASTTGAARANGGTGGGAGGRAPGVTGLIAAVEGTTLQVQSNTEQTAVTYTKSTKITGQVATTASALAVGDCVMARPATTGGAAANGGTAPDGAPASTAPAPTTVAAGTVQIISTGQASCAAGRDDFGGGRGSSARPSGAPTDRPTGTGTGQGRPGGGGFGGFGAIGTVASLGKDTFTITEAVGPQATGSSSTPRTVTVTYTGTTTFSASKAAPASAIKEGGCVTAIGPTDDVGTVAATSLSLSPAEAGQCTNGLRRG